jgi:hypothetical protein
MHLNRDGCGNRGNRRSFSATQENEARILVIDEVEVIDAIEGWMRNWLPVHLLILQRRVDRIALLVPLNRC